MSDTYVNTGATLAQRMALCAADGYTLDGLPARVRGYRNDFATVRNARYGVEFAWQTVALIQSRGGAFSS